MSSHGKIRSDRGGQHRHSSTKSDLSPTAPAAGWNHMNKEQLAKFAIENEKNLKKARVKNSQKKLRDWE